MTSVSKAAFDQLQASLAHGRPDAPRLADTLLQHHPDPLSNCLVRGLMLLADGRNAEAYAAFLQASTLAPADARAYLGLGQSLLQLGHGDKAILASQEALRHDPANWQARLVIADSLAATGQWSHAIGQYERVLMMGGADVSVRLGLGNALVKAGRLAEAKDQFAHAVAMEPDRAVGYCNLGYVHMLMGQHPEAIRLFRQALPRTGETPELIHTNLAHACFAMEDFAGAAEESARALAHRPDLAIAHGVRADALRKLGRHGEAVAHYRRHGTPESRAKAIECLYRLGDMEVFAAAQEELAASQPDNIRLAAISALAAARHGARFASRFCADPLSQVAACDITEKLEPFAAFREALLAEAAALEAVWEPPAKTTKGGFQTEGNLFALGTPAVARLEAVVREAVAAYFAARGDCGRYASHAPKEFSLTGWVVRLRQSGRQDAHIHPDGWLSGVLYLKLPPRAGDEGAIAFTLGGHFYTGAAAAPELLHHPQEGELVLFPSSLFHYTVPFRGDGERISVAFDLIPAKS